MLSFAYYITSGSALVHFHHFSALQIRLLRLFERIACWVLVGQQQLQQGHLDITGESLARHWAVVV